MENQKLGRFEIVGELGKGAMGIVYKATDPLLNRAVAIKTINLSADQDEMADFEARFQLEAKAAGGLNHPNIVTVYDIGNAGNVAYLAMELLEGAELRARMTSGARLPIADAAGIAMQVAEGLAYAHQHGVVHRDIKPANIMIVRDGLVKITDFGIARMRSADVRTQTGVMLGSPKYMSPEQVLGKRAEPGSDIFSLGVILYEMLTGKAPFTGADVNALMFQIVNLAPPAPSSINAQVPAMLDFIVAKALAKAPDERYANARELAADLRECASRLDPAAQTTAPPSAMQPAPARIDTNAATQLMAGTFPHAREGDESPAVIDITATLGLSKAFDSAAATARLAVQTGVTGAATSPNVQPDAATTVRGTVMDATLSQQKIPRFDRIEAWGSRDKLVFWAGVGVATLVGAAIVLL
jgi:serine/threonine-protein kinase